MSEASAAIRVVVADDHPIFRHGARGLLEIDPDLRVVGEASDGIAALVLVRQLHPDVILLDVAMPNLDGLEALPEIRDASLETRILIVTAEIGRMDLVRALQTGARGVLLKAAAARLLRQAVRAVAAGSYWVGPDAAADLVAALRHAGSQPPPFGLSSREMEVIVAIVGRETNREVARRLGVTERTVKHHLTNIFLKTGVSTRLELALFAIKHRLTDDR